MWNAISITTITVTGMRWYWISVGYVRARKPANCMTAMNVNSLIFVPKKKSIILPLLQKTMIFSPVKNKKRA
jgi:hypothetical protein